MLDVSDADPDCGVGETQDEVVNETVLSEMCRRMDLNRDEAVDALRRPFSNQLVPLPPHTLTLTCKHSGVQKARIPWVVHRHVQPHTHTQTTTHVRARTYTTTKVDAVRRHLEQIRCAMYQRGWLVSR